MIQHRGNMWDIYPHTDLFLVTTNNCLKDDGALIMGAGIAKVARDRFPGLDLALGNAIRERCPDFSSDYGLLVSPTWPEKKLGAFQTKRLYNEPALIPVIKHSTNLLIQWANAHPDARIDLNYPGIGKGHLHINDVYPIIQKLPDNVHVWRFNK